MVLQRGILHCIAAGINRLPRVLRDSVGLTIVSDARNPSARSASSRQGRDEDASISQDATTFRASGSGPHWAAAGVKDLVNMADGVGGSHRPRPGTADCAIPYFGRCLRPGGSTAQTQPHLVSGGFVGRPGDGSPTLAESVSASRQAAASGRLRFIALRIAEAPNSSASTGMRSSTPWMVREKSKPSGSCMGRKP
jgi:hypothetical protein